MTDDFIRHSVAEQVQIVTDANERARREASNALLQAERVRQKILEVIDGRPFKLRPSTILEFNRCAIKGLDAFAGNYRAGPVKIEKSNHQPPDAHLVAEFVEEMCDYVNNRAATHSAIHLSSFVMWRLNWIHPFTDGNGRTSRAASYYVLCSLLAISLPGTKTIPEQIVENRKPYYDAIEAADEAYKKDGLSDMVVYEMEKLIEGMLAEQLAYLHENAKR